MYRVKKQLQLDYEAVAQLDGNSVYSVVLDSGIIRHPDFGHRILDFKDFVNNRISLYDNYGHGTHVTGILCGNGSLSQGRFAGIAPQVRILSAKILNERGEGDTIHLIRALEWVRQMKSIYPIRIINISVSLDKKEEQLSEYATKNLSIAKEMLQEFWHDGMFITVAAGNCGPEEKSISQLGVSSNVVCVGCHDDSYVSENGCMCDSYSGRGPGNNEIKKPDIVAPGTDIMSCNSLMYYNKLGRRNSPYIQKSGTSMATPIVSGCAALFFQKYPNKTNEDAKRKMLISAKNIGEAWTKQGWGMIDPVRFLT